jgi:hypothetical protein
MTSTIAINEELPMKDAVDQRVNIMSVPSYDGPILCQSRHTTGLFLIQLHVYNVHQSAHTDCSN